VRLIYCYLITITCICNLLRGKFFALLIHILVNIFQYANSENMLEHFFVNYVFVFAKIIFQLHTRYLMNLGNK